MTMQLVWTVGVKDLSAKQGDNSTILNIVCMCCGMYVCEYVFVYGSVCLVMVVETCL